MTVHGLAPYFQRQLVNKIQQCEHIVVGFDESLNKVAQRQQMDLNVRFWNNETNEVETRYLTSEFLGRSSAMDGMLLKKQSRVLTPKKLSKYQWMDPM